jgi:16S rRNA processing protein RimM
METADTIYITVGKICSPYGVQGWLKIQPYTELGASILEYSPWYLSKPNNLWELISIEAARIHGKGVVAKLAGINSPETARLLTGQTIAVRREQLPKLKPNEYYWSDLIGLTVINKNGEILGKIKSLMATGANDVLVVKGTKEHAIPYLPGQVILDVNLETQEMHVDWELI